jgi:hypothetical protein
MSKRPGRPDDPTSRGAKRTGERSEAAFLYQASQRCFGISKPWGDSERYDFILDNRPKPEVRLFRMQVKGTEAFYKGAYETQAVHLVGGVLTPYTKCDIDFIAVHIIPLKIWYIIPVEVCTPQPLLRFYPGREAKGTRLEQYREAWHLLDPPLPNPPLTIHACIDPDYPELDYAEEADPGAYEREMDLPESQ